MKLLLLFYCSFFVVSMCNCQDVFEVQCAISNLQGFKCKAYVSINEGKNGFLRVQITAPKTFDKTIVDMDLIPESSIMFYYPPTQDSFLYVKAEVVKKISGKKDYDFNYLDIWFKKNNRTNGKFLPCTDSIPILWEYNFNANTLVYPVFAYQEKADSLGNKFNGVASAISKARQLNAAQLTREKLSEYFTNLELTTVKKFTAAQLNAVRYRNRPTLYCITVTDVKDKTIYEACKQDSKNIYNFFSEVSSFINLNFKPIKIEDNNYNVASINNVINSLHPKKNDIIVFTFSGHGFSYRNDEEHQFPQLALWEGDAESQTFLRASTLNIENIYNKIKEKGAGLNIVMADCCNTYVEMERYIDSIVISALETFPRWNKKATVNLFENSRGSFLLAAAKKGQLAGSTASYGGFLTESFWKNLRSNVRNRETSNPQWLNIIHDIGKTANAKAPNYICETKPCEQTMIYKVN